jgi:ABC-type polysaccharide/polyol phosphate transport system ATPase subunit
MLAISFYNVSKQFTCYNKGGLYLRDRLTHALQQLMPFNRGFAWPHLATEAKIDVRLRETAAGKGLRVDSRWLPQTSARRKSLEWEFWALKNVSFEIKEGESVGFIGRNGAGKSTILKLLAGVTKPSKGKVTVNGRVAALIEVGAGFHPELSGRDNIYLNGSILGMKKAEIDKSFDSIVSFSELERFIDIPVKHYSSGMYVRLGFAVAAHTNPAIYLIDEVLAVGDEAFQRKCLDMLATHRTAGKTMILVSHQLNRIEEVCSRCIYIDRGEIRFDGLPQQGIVRYRDDLMQAEVSESEDKSVNVGKKIQLFGVTFRDVSGKESSTFQSGEDLIIEIGYRTNGTIENAVLSINVYGPNDERVAGLSTLSSSLTIATLEQQGVISCRLMKLPLLNGFYSVSVELSDYYDTELYDYLRRGYRFEITCAKRNVSGFVRLDAQWGGDAMFKRVSTGLSDSHVGPR